MPRRIRSTCLLSVSASSVAALLVPSFAAAQTDQRVLGLDISAWQGNISQTTWNNIRNVENRQFVFLRSSRGGTTGFYNQNDPDNELGQNTLSQRYDDPYFIQNINRATAAGMFAGAYHYGRHDILSNTAVDEANHFMQMASPWMRPGYLMPVFDLEGDQTRTDQGVANFCLDFSNHIYQQMGIRPVMYINGQYALNVLQQASVTTRNQLAQPSPNAPSMVSPAYPVLWVARYPAGSGNQYFGDVQNENPNETFAGLYGPWDDYGNAQPWHFWQYSSGGRLQSFNNGNSNLDFNVAHGDSEWLKNQLVPAVWTNDSSGDWSTLANWNSGQTPVAPVTPPDQVQPVATGPLPTPRLPGAAGSGPTAGANDTVILERPNADITVTLSGGAHNIRKLYMRETLNITGGSLTINYDPTYRDPALLTNVAHAGPISAQFSGPVNISGGASLTAHTIQVDPARNFTAGSANLTFNTLTLQRGATPAKLVLNGDVNVAGLAGATAVIKTNTGAGNSGELDLGGGARNVAVANGAAATDLRVEVPIKNGDFTKTGAGTLELTADNSAYAGILAINDGHLRLTGANQIGTTGVRTNTLGAVRIDGNGLNFNREIRLGGRGGTSAQGALQNLSGNNTWSGEVVLAGTQHNTSEAGLNRISASAGTTLTLSGVMRDDDEVTPGVLRSWAKQGAGDVVLTGGSANRYSDLTRVLEGRLIIEKDEALGETHQGMVDHNTLQIASANSQIAFRAPTGSPGLNYTAGEWIFTEGGGVNGAQLDSLGGTNVFAGHVGLGGPIVNTVRQSYLGVTTGSLEIKGGLHARSTTGTQRNIFKRGAGTLILSGTNTDGPSNNFAGVLGNGSTFTIEGGTVRLLGFTDNRENVAGVDTWTVNNGTALALAQGGAAGNAAVVFNGGTLRAEASLVAVNALNFSGSGALEAGAGVNATFSGITSGGGNVNKSGSGNIFLGGAVNGFAGGINVTNGTLGVAQSSANSAVANITTISVTGGGRFDLADNDLIVRTTAASAVEQFVALGYAGGAWNGSGIVSSVALANNWLDTLGVATFGSLGLTGYAGHSGLAADDTLVRFTYYGDSDLTGVVNRNDFLLFRDGFLNLSPDAWHFGDFNYSGVVDANDWALYLRGLRNQPGGGMSDAFRDELLAFADENGLDATLVPEPTGLALLAVGAGAMLRRRRRVG